jgi:poly-gamma-glutamate capsule biosynthesis protein CapA/YwtB (metallophosphatase superfamily)
VSSLIYKGMGVMKAGVIVTLFILFLLLLSSCQIHNGTSLERKYVTDPIIPKKSGPTVGDSSEAEEDNSEDNTDGAMEGENQVARIMFIGDNMMDGKVALVMDEKGNEYPLTQFMPILQEANLVIANLETSVGRSGALEEKGYAFQSDPSRFDLFEPLRENIVFSLANNHGMDAPLLESMQELDQLNYAYIGVGVDREDAFKPYVRSTNGISIAVIAASRVIPFSRWAAGERSPGMASAYVDQPLLSLVQHWTGEVDYVIVYLHWGEELVDHPNQEQLELEEKLISAGANIIIGSHPHVLQGIQYNNERQLTAYSLGNFVFTTSSNVIANDTMVLDISLSKKKIEHVQIWPGQVQFGLVRSLETKDEKERIFSRLRELSPQINIDLDGRVTVDE